MRKHAWICGGIAACLLWAPALQAQIQRPAAHQAGAVRPASYCASCSAGAPAYSAPIYGEVAGPACESCGVAACQPCGGCGSLIRELFCDVKTLVDVSVGSVVRCLIPCAPACEPCGAPACGPMECASCGVSLPNAGGPVPMLEPIPAPSTPGQPDPFRDDPVNTSRMMPRRTSGYSYAPQPRTYRGAQPASYATPVTAPDANRYRPQHTSQLRRATTYSAPAPSYR